MLLNKFSVRALLASLALSLSLLIAPATQAATVNSFDDIQFWTGTGSNESALVIQFNDGNSPVSLAWGFRWDDANTSVETMLLSLAGSISGGPSPIAGSDSRLGLTLGFFAGLGYYVDGVTYDQNGLAGETQIVRSQSGYDPGTSSYWALYLGTDGNAFPANGTFAISDFGAASTLLSDHGWYGLSYSPGDDFYNFSIPEAAAIPEPSSTILLVLAGSVLFLLIRRNARSKNSILVN